MEPETDVSYAGDHTQIVGMDRITDRLICVKVRRPYLLENGTNQGEEVSTYTWIGRGL